MIFVDSPLRCKRFQTTASSVPNYILVSAVRGMGGWYTGLDLVAAVISWFRLTPIVHGIWRVLGWTFRGCCIRNLGFGVWAGLDRIAKLILEKGRF